MYKILICVTFVLLAPFAAQAQPDYPPVEVFGGYSYFRTGPEEFNLNGWNASVTGNITDWFGIEWDLSGHYGHPLDSFGRRIPDLRINHHTFMAGPKLSYRAGSMTPFAHFLIGGARAGTIDDFYRDRTADWALVTVIGAGVDINLSKTVALRVAQADWMRTQFDTGPFPEDRRQNNFRFSAGIVLKLGSR